MRVTAIVAFLDRYGIRHRRRGCSSSGNQPSGAHRLGDNAIHSIHFICGRFCVRTRVFVAIVLISGLEMRGLVFWWTYNLCVYDNVLSII